MTVVLALDIATQTGVAVGEHTGAPKAWSVDLGKGKSEDARFSQVLFLTHQLIVEHEPELIVVEAAIGGKTKSDFLIGLVACVRGCAYNRKIPVEQCTSASVRKHFVGKALTTRDFPGQTLKAAKRAIKQVVVDRCEMLGWAVPDDDAADAAATWDFGCAKWVRNYNAKPLGEMFQ